MTLHSDTSPYNSITYFIIGCLLGQSGDTRHLFPFFQATESKRLQYAAQQALKAMCQALQTTHRRTLRPESVGFNAAYLLDEVEQAGSLSFPSLFEEIIFVEGQLEQKERVWERIRYGLIDLGADHNVAFAFHEKVFPVFAGWELGRRKCFISPQHWRHLDERAFVNLICSIFEISPKAIPLNLIRSPALPFKLPEDSFQNIIRGIDRHQTIFVPRRPHCITLSVQDTLGRSCALLHKSGNGSEIEKQPQNDGRSGGEKREQGNDRSVVYDDDVDSDGEVDKLSEFGS